MGLKLGHFGDYTSEIPRKVVKFGAEEGYRITVRSIFREREEVLQRV
jgi:hypothetical protein